LIGASHEEQHRGFAPLSNGDARETIRVISMHAVLRYRRRSIVALAVVLVGVFFTVPSGAAASHTAAAHAGVAQRFLALSTDPGENAKPTILAFGGVHAKGVDRQVGPRKDVFVFPDGNLTVRHQPVAHHRHHDPVTCLFTFRERGTFKITRGTGAYAGARGHGRYHVKVMFVGCRHQPPEPHTFSLTIQASGRIHL
jgi:hypothetical protein